MRVSCNFPICLCFHLVSVCVFKYISTFLIFTCAQVCLFILNFHKMICNHIHMCFRYVCVRICVHNLIVLKASLNTTTKLSICVPTCVFGHMFLFIYAYFHIFFIVFSRFCVFKIFIFNTIIFICTFLFPFIHM